MSYQNRVKQHSEAYFGSSAQEQIWDKSFVAQNVLGLKCFEFQPSDEFAFFSYVSCGLTSLLPDHNIKHEYVISSPFGTLEHAELMSMIAAALTNRNAYFGLGDIIPVGRPWIYGAEAKHLLVCLPYPYGPKLEIADSVMSGLRILWLLPIFDSEVEFCAAHGVEALEEKFDEQAIRFWDLKRKPVA